MTITIAVTSTDPMGADKAFLQMVLGLAATGTGGAPGINFFPSDPGLAPFPSPEKSQQLILNGAISGEPYLKDSLGTIHTLVVNATTGAAEYWVNGASQMVNWSAHSDAPPAQLLVAQGGVYIFLIDGITQQFRGGSIYNTAVPAFWTTTPAGGGTPSLPALPPDPTPSALAPGTSGKVINCGVGQILTTLSAAIPTTKAGDTVKLAPGTYTDTPPAWTVPLLIDLGGATFNATGKTATLARGKGLLVPAADSIIQNGTITGVAMDQTTGQLTSAIRPDVGCGFLTIKNVAMHQNQCGVGEGGVGSCVIELDNCDVSLNGLKVNSGANTHNIYVGQDCVRMTLTNVISNGCNDAHACKYRGPVLIVNGGTFASANGLCFDLPNGGTKPFSLTGVTLLKAAADPDHVIFGYGEEGATNGLVGGTINGGVIVALCPSPIMIGPGGTIALSGVTLTGNPITAQQGLTVTKS